MLTFAVALTLAADTLTWSGPAQTLDKLLPALGAKAGKPWKASADVAGEVVFIGVREVDPTEFETKLAKTLNCVWEDSEGNRMLTRRAPVGPAEEDLVGKAIAKQAIAEADEQLAKKVTAAIAINTLKEYRRVEDPSSPDNSQAWTARQRLEAISPQRRLILRIISAIGEAKLAKALESRRSVFVHQPNKKQYSLPADLSKFVAQTTREKEIWTTALEGDKPENGNSTVSMPMNVFAAVKDVRTLRLEIVRQPDSSTALFNLQVVTNYADGPFQTRPVGQYFATVPGFYESLRDSKDSKSPEIKFSEESRQEIKAIQASTYGRPRVELPDSSIIRYLNPSQYDPLGTFVSEALTQWAEHKKTNIIAQVPDVMWNTVAYLDQANALTTDSVDAIFADLSMGLTTTTEGNWTTVQTRPLGRKCWADRTAAKGLFLRSIGGLPLSLDDQATLEFEGAVHRAYWVRARLQMLTDSAGMPQTSGARDAYILWGSLTPAQRGQLRKKEKLLISTLSAEQKKIAESMLYAEIMEGNEWGESSWMSRVAGQQTDPTDACPDGFPPSAYLSMDVKSYPRLWAYGGTKEKPVLLRIFERGQAAQMMAAPLTLDQWFGGHVNLVGFAVGRENLADLKLVVGPKWWHTYRLIDGYERPKTKPMKYEDIPKEERTPKDF